MSKLLPLLLLTACLAPVAAIPDDQIGTETGTPPEEATPVVPATEVGADGGIIEGPGGVTLDIPAGALGEPAMIRIVDTGVGPEAPYEGLSNVYAFEPEGLSFEGTVTVTIPFEGDGFPHVFWADGSGFSELDATFDEEGSATFSVDSLASGFVSLLPLETVVEEALVQPADILLVVDNSCSMAEEQQQLAQDLTVVLDGLLDVDADFHIGVTTTDVDSPALAGKLRNIQGQRFVSADSAQPGLLLSMMVNAGTSGSADEKGRAAAFQVLGPNASNPANVGFIRSEGTLDVIFLSDENDRSVTPSLPDWYALLAGLKPTLEEVRLNAVTGVQGSSCGAVSEVGTLYAEYVTNTDGQLIDICEADWTAGLRSIVDARFPVPSIELGVAVDEVVSVSFLENADSEGRELTASEYTVDGEVVRLDQGVVPAAGQSVEVVFRPL